MSRSERRARWRHVVALLAVVDRLRIAAVLSDDGRAFVVHHGRTPRAVLRRIPATWRGVPVRAVLTNARMRYRIADQNAARS